MTPTTQQTPPQGGFQFANAGVAERPKLTATGIITRLGDPKTTQQGDGYYEMFDIYLEPTRASKKVFPRALFRAEMFSPGFNPQSYTDYASYPALQTIPEGKDKPLGEGFANTYRMNVFPNITLQKGPDGTVTPKFDKDTGLVLCSGITPVMAICGGTLAGMEAMTHLIVEALAAVQGRAAGQMGLVELTPQEVVDVLRKYLAQIGPIEQAVTLKQSKDQQGNLKDSYEVASWEGPFSPAVHAKLQARAEKSATKPTAQRLQIGYTL